MTPLSVTIIPYARDLPLVDLDQHPRVAGCKYLLCFMSGVYDAPIYVAMRWKRVLPVGLPGHQVIVSFVEVHHA